MYNVVVVFDNLTEVYQLRDYNEKIKDAIEYLNTYGCDSIEFVCKGEIIENAYKIFTIESMIKRFEDCEFFEAYCDESEQDMMEEYKDLLRSVAVK